MPFLPIPTPHPMAPLSEWSSISLFCPDTPVWQTSIWSSISSEESPNLLSLPSPAGGVYSVLEAEFHRRAYSTLLYRLTHASPSLSSLWAPWVLRHSTAFLHLRDVCWMKERINPSRLTLLHNHMFFGLHWNLSWTQPELKPFYINLKTKNPTKTPSCFALFPWMLCSAHQSLGWKLEWAISMTAPVITPINCSP